MYEIVNATSYSFHVSFQILWYPCTNRQHKTVDERQFAGKKDTAEIKKDSTEYKDSVRVDKLFQTAEQPIIKNSKWSGVIPVVGIDEKPDPKMKYKLLVEITWWEKRFNKTS